MLIFYFSSCLSNIGATEIAAMTSNYFTTSMAGGAEFCNSFHTTAQTPTGPYYDYWSCFSGDLSTRSSIPETPVSLSYSQFNGGGGFSNYFPRPAYQSSVVGAYLAANVAGMPPSSYYNRSGRAVPDVSMYGSSHFPWITNGAISTNGGTSLSSPLFAAVIAQLNEISLASMGQTLGFINPLLYAMKANQSSTFFDIVTGSNSCPRICNGPYGGNSNCGSQAFCESLGCQGFPATVGYDAVTGLGSPNVRNMIQFMEQLTGSYVGLSEVDTSTGRNSASSVNNISTISLSIIVALTGFFLSQ